MALRFIMGMFEAPALATCTLITVIWYTKTEQPLRVAIWSATFASVYVGLLSYGVGHSSSAIASWRLLFLVLGSISFVLSVLMLFFFPDHPTSPRFLKDKEIYIALQRLRLNNTGDENKVSQVSSHVITRTFSDDRFLVRHSSSIKFARPSWIGNPGLSHYFSSA